MTPRISSTDNRRCSAAKDHRAGIHFTQEDSPAEIDEALPVTLITSE
jgi:hypothetical protein